MKFIMKLFPLSFILSFLTMLATAQAEEHTVRTGSGQATVYVVAEDELHNLSRDRAEAVIGATSRVRAQVIGDTDIRELVLYPKGEARTESNRRVLTREVLVRLAAGTDVARLAREVGADAGLEIPYAPRHYILRVTQPGAALKVAAALATMAGVEHVEPVLKRKLAKRSVPNDPLFNQQWTLRNTGQNGATADADINVVDVWATYKGTGITVGVIDDGLEYSHPDLAANANTTIDYDFRDSDDDPKPEGGSGKNAKDEPNADSHGTATAGVIAARGNNGVGAVGVAFEATLVGLRLIGGTAGDTQEGAALSHRNSDIHIYNNSWGPNDDGTVKGGAGTLALAALKNGVTSGRGGRGSIYVWAAGNGGAELDNAGYDSYNGSIYTVSVAALNDLGQRADYSERGACLVVTAPSGNDATRAQGTTTTDLVGDFGYNRSDVAAGPVGPADLADRNYTQNYNGTSSAAPVVSGVVALMLQANPNLGWRDVQEVLIRSATQTDPQNNEWRTNKAGFKFNPNFGAGRVNAGAAVALAKNWTNLPVMTFTASKQPSLTVAIPDDNSTGITRSFDLSTSNLRVEQTVVTVDITHAKRGDLVINLVSPSGTISPLAELHGDTNADYTAMTFRSTFNWGEDSKGTWQLQVSDRRAGNTGTLTRAELEVFGSANEPPVITGFNPQPVAAGGEVTLTGTFPTGSVPVITLENASGTTVATLTAGSNTGSQIKATVPTGTASGTYGLKVKFGTASTSGYVELGITTFAVGTSGGAAPTITAQPANVTIPNSERTQLKVTATGTGTLTYQWYQGQSGITTTPVAGATTPTITTPALSATTSYWVRITDGNGVVTNSPTVTVTVSATSPLTVTQQVLGPGYHGGGAVVVTNIITYTGNAPSRIDWATLLPAGWKYLGSGGSEGGARPPYESGDLLDWSWTTVPASPIKFSYTVSVPAGTTGDQVIASLVTSQAAGTSYRTMAKPDPLVIRSASLSSASLHSADSDRDGRISLIELTRVIELYNYRSGTVRTGQYKPQAGTEDGFAPGPVTPSLSANPVAPGGVVTLTGTFPADQGEPRVFLASSSGTTLDLILGNHSASSITATVPASTPVGTYELKVAFGTLNLGTVANFVVGTSGGGGGGSSSAVLRSGLGEGSALPADSGLALGVVAVSSGAATYAWTKSGSAVGSDVQKAFTVTSATVGDYRLALNGTPAESIGISISASSAPPRLITSLPNSVHVQTGQNVVLGISVSSGSITSGAPSFTGGVFAWAKDGSLQAGRTDNAWNLGAVSSSSAGFYTFYAGAGVPGPTTFAVSASGASAYVINGSSNPSLSVVRGQTYTFAVNASGHKLWIQSAAGSYSSSGTYNVGVNNNGTATGSIVWTVATDTPDTLYYICEAHSAMAGTISVSAPLGTGSGSTERLATSTQLVVGAAGNALLYGPGAGPAVIGSPLTITGSMVPGDGVSVVWVRKPSGGTAFAAVSTASGSTYAAATSGSMHSLSISSLAAAMAGDQFRFVATRAGVSFTSEIYVLP